MTDTTTIEIHKEQKRALDDFKRVESESYKSVLQRLIDGYGDPMAGDYEDKMREIAREEISERVVGEAQV